MSEISFECVFEDSRFPGFEIYRYYIKAHIPILDFLFFNINKGCIKEFSLLPVCYGFFGKAVVFRRPSLDLYEADYIIILCNYIELTLPAAKILIKDAVALFF
jgi:hypothetical protein